jgi:hypothetical protein
MLYDKISKGEDGLYHTNASTDDNKRCFIQLNNVKMVNNENDDEASFDLLETDNNTKIADIDKTNIKTALENSKEWFGNELPENVITQAYCEGSSVISPDIIDATRVFNSRKELIENGIKDVKIGSSCTILIEFSGLWFAKKAFGPSWNLVQVKVHEEKNSEPEISEKESYPDEYTIQDDE